MSRYLLRRLPYAKSLWFVGLLLLLPMGCLAQSLLPTQRGEKVRYAAYIEMPKGYVSGICILLNDSTEVKGSLFNEFGVTALDFSYLPAKDRVRLHHVIGMMDKWYIRRVLKRDLREVMHQLQQGQTSYRDEKYTITYQFTPVVDSKTRQEETNIKQFKTYDTEE